MGVVGVAFLKRRRNLYILFLTGCPQYGVRHNYAKLRSRTTVLMSGPLNLVMREVAASPILSLNSRFDSQTQQVDPDFEHLPAHRDEIALHFTHLYHTL